MNQNLTGKYIGELRGRMLSLAEAAMLRPKAEPFAHGVQTGQYQGLQIALDVLESLLRDEVQTEKSL